VRNAPGLQELAPDVSDGLAIRRIDAITWLYVVAVVATFSAGLIVDQYGGLIGQLAVSAWSWLLMLRLISASPARWRSAFFACLVWATAGEIFLSLVWGLYTYRLGNIPFFIPPGHVFLFWLGLTFAPRLPAGFVYTIPVVAIGYAGHAFYQGFDTVSIPLVALFVLCWLQPHGRRLYSLMLVISLAVELYGTWLGNWTWHREVNYFPLNSANPPLAAGSFYCMLDVLVGLTVRMLSRSVNCASATVAPARSGAGAIQNG
jgi:hypothetical protein